MAAIRQSSSLFPSSSQPGPEVASIVSSYIMNSTQPNSLSKNNSMDMFYFYRPHQIVFLWVLFLFIVAGNGSVLAAIRLSESSDRTRMNFFILHLSIADLSVGLINVFTDIIWETTIEWYGGDVLCRIVRYAQIVVTYASTYVLVSLSIDRVDAVALPMNFTGRVFRARMLIAIAWILSLVFSTPMLAINYLKRHDNGRLQCWMEFPLRWHWQMYVTLVALAIFIIPALIIAVCYSIIIYVVWTKSRGIEKQHINPGKKYCRGVIPQAKIRTIKMTLLIVLVFIICWSPYFMFDLLDAFDVFSPSPTKTAASTFIQSLAPLNCAANPIIYGIFSTRICRNLRNIHIPCRPLMCYNMCRGPVVRDRRRMSPGVGSSTDQTPVTVLLSSSRQASYIPMVQRNVQNAPTAIKSNYLVVSNVNNVEVESDLASTLKR